MTVLEKSLNAIVSSSKLIEYNTSTNDRLSKDRIKECNIITRRVDKNQRFEGMDFRIIRVDSEVEDTYPRVTKDYLTGGEIPYTSKTPKLSHHHLNKIFRCEFVRVVDVTSLVETKSWELTWEMIGRIRKLDGNFGSELFTFHFMDVLTIEDLTND